MRAEVAGVVQADAGGLAAPQGALGTTALQLGC